MEPRITLHALERFRERLDPQASFGDVTRHLREAHPVPDRLLVYLPVKGVAGARWHVGLEVLFVMSGGRALTCYRPRRALCTLLRRHVA